MSYQTVIKQNIPKDAFKPPPGKLRLNKITQ